MTWALCAVLMPAVSPIARAEITWDTAALALDDTGRVVSLIDGRDGRNYAVPGSPFCTAETDQGVQQPVRADCFGPNDLRIKFDGGAELRFTLRKGHGYVLFELRRILGVARGTVRSLSLFSLSIDGLDTIAPEMGACYGAQFAVAVMGTHINVHGGCESLSDGRAALRATTYREHGIQPAGFGLIATPREDFPATIEAFEQAAALPSPHPGGVWEKLSPWTKESYLFISGMHEAEADEVIEWAKRGGFTTVLIAGDWSRSHGHHEINLDLYPEGLESLRRVAEQLKGAGLRVGLHFLAAAVYLDDPYVTPVPDRRLVVDARATLAADTDEAADFIPTTEPPSGLPTEDGGYMGRGCYVRISDELVEYAKLSMDPPYGLSGCRRGALGTVAARHTGGDAAEHLHRSYGYFLFDLDSDLADEVIGNVCRVANAIDADMLYLDGSELLQGDHWYYNAKMQSMYYERMANKNVFMQGSSYSHYSWHVISRMASADGHGDVKGYLDERIPWFASYAANLMPLDIGWYYVYDKAVTSDQFEYILQRCLGFGASISVQTNPEELRTHPEMGHIFDMVATYDRLRHSGRVGEDMLAKLREPKREYRYLDNPPRLRRVRYGEWRDMAATDGGANAFEETPVAEGARLGFDIRCGALTRPGAAYRSDDAVLLEGFDDLAAYSTAPSAEKPVLTIGQDAIGGTSPGVTQELSLVGNDGPEGGRCARYTAASASDRADGWSAVGKHFDPPLDLSRHKAIGFWLRGDGGGGMFKLQIRDATGATDYYINNDFTEWRYIQVLRPTRAQPLPVDYSRITDMMFYYNGLPAHTTVTCLVADVKALPAVDAAEIRNPAITVGDQQLTVPVTLTEGDRLLCIPGAAPELIHAQTGEREMLPLLQDLPLTGPASGTLSCDGPLTSLMQMRLVQDVPEELPLPRARR